MTETKFPLLKKSIILFILIVCSPSLNAQIFDKIFIEGDAVTKFSVGKETRDSFKYRDNITIDVPNKSKFDSPVVGLNFSLNYKFNEKFSTGLGSGINIIKNQKHPIVSNEYYDKILFPLFVKFRYQKQFFENWVFLIDLNGGYQLSDFRYGNSNEGFDFQMKGGFLANIDLGIGKDLGKYTPILKLGYEINQFRHEDSLGWIDDSLQYNDKIEYKTYYHLIKLSLSIQI